MSVIQISKIQVRRGRKSDVGSVPQLSSAEFAWAVDTQELYIGNGSITEGAPYVGNTKILTEHDNILEFISGYTFGKDNVLYEGISRSEERSIQSKLDETVSIFDYGAIPDGSTDCTFAFERAFEDLFGVNASTSYRKVLLVPNGRYSFNLPNRPLRIPSWANIQGETVNETVIDIGNSGIEFVSRQGTTPGNFSDSDFPHNIKISNLTILHGDGQTEITASRSCEFERVKWVSDYQLGDTVFVEENANAVYLLPIVTSGGNIQIFGTGITAPLTQQFFSTYQTTLNSLVGFLNNDSLFQQTFIAVVVGTSLKITSINQSTPASEIDNNITIIVQPSNEDPAAVVTPVLTEYQDGSQNVQSSVYWTNQSFSTRTSEIVFDSCVFESTRLAIECQQQEIFDSRVTVSNSKFLVCDTGIYIGGVPNDNVLGSQGNLWDINDCDFDEISNHAFISTNGIGTKFSRTKFKNCGIGTGSSQNPVSAIVSFGEQFNNVLIDCSSDRHQSSAFTSEIPNSPAIVEFENSSSASLIDKNYTSIFVSESARAMSVFSVNNKFIELDYLLKLGTHVRKGKLTIVVGDSNNSDNVGVYDEYTYSPKAPSSPGGQLMTNFDFSATVETISSIPTLILRYRNPISTGSIGTISYSITYGG